MTNRLAPLNPPFSTDIERILSRYPKQDGYILSLFRTFANSVRFLEKAVPNLLDRGSPLSLRTREIIILRTTSNRNCEYEWGVHVAIFAEAAQLTPTQIQATRPSRSTCWSNEELRLISAVDQLCNSGILDSETLAHFQDDFTCEQQLEIMALIGTYSTISYVANVAQLPLEPFAEHFPRDTGV